MRLKEWILKKVKKKSPASSLLTSVVGIMTFLVVFCAVCDLVVLSHQNSMLTDTGKEIARTLSVQGGSLDTKPVGFASNYYPISELSTLVKRNMEMAGFRDKEWAVEVSYTRYYDDTTETSVDVDTKHVIMGFDDTGAYYYVPTLKIDYLSDFTVTVTGTYDWKFLSAILGKRSSTLSVPLPGMSEFKYNYDAWPSEK